jgi:cell shape-determining protein MreC
VVVYRQDRRRRLTLVLLVITSLVLISLDERGSAVLDSVRSAAQDVIAPVQGVVDDLGRRRARLRRRPVRRCRDAPGVP